MADQNITSLGCPNDCDYCDNARRARKEQPNVKPSPKFEGNPHWCPAWEIFDGNGKRLPKGWITK